MRIDGACHCGEIAWEAEIAHSGAARDLAFCGTCGTPLYGTQAEAPVTYSLRLGSARQARELTPRMQIWPQSAMPWAASACELQPFEQPFK